MAVGLFWILDAAMNTAMEPYRAMVGDLLPRQQRSVGFAMQTFMIAGGQILAGLMPLILLAWGVSADTDGQEIPDIVKYSFVIGVVAMLASMAWTASTTHEHPPANLHTFKAAKEGTTLIGRTWRELVAALREMPDEIRRLWWAKFFSWYGLPLMWQYLALSIARHSFDAPKPDSPGFAEGAANVGVAFTVMNVTTVFMAFTVPALVARLGTRFSYAGLLAIGGAGFVSMHFNDNLSWVFGCMVLVGIGWSGVITLPFIIATDVVAPERVGVYMGLLNAFICLPQIISMLTVGLFYDTLLQGDPRNALVLCGVCFLLAAAAAMRLRGQRHAVAIETALEGETATRSLSEH
jgi:maltose/moltooligosaccharide transporter